jgi:hypothetical protein
LLACWSAEPISSTLKMEAICSSETSVETQRTTRRHIPEDDTLNSLSHSQQLLAGLYPEQVESRMCILTPYVYKILFEVIPYIPRSPTVPFPFRLFDQSFVCISRLRHTCYMPRPPHCPGFNHSKSILWK